MIKPVRRVTARDRMQGHTTKGEVFSTTACTTSRVYPTFDMERRLDI